MPLLLPATKGLSLELVFAQGERVGEERAYSLANLRTLTLPWRVSPWAACADLMERGYLPPFELVRQLHEEEVEYGDVAKRLWVLRGARRTARLVQEAGTFTLRQVQDLKRSVQGWR
jgi:hypothetical protein